MMLVMLQIADETFDAINELIGMAIAIVVLALVNIYVGLCWSIVYRDYF